MLTVLAQRGDMRRASTDAKLLGHLAGIKPTGGTFSEYLRQLRKAGYVEGQRQALTITDAGLKALGSYEPLPTAGRPRLDWFMDRYFNARQCAMLEHLWHRYPNGASKRDLAYEASIEPAGGTCSEYLRQLRARGVVEGPADNLRLSEAVMED
jgi:hypothetical protein